MKRWRRDKTMKKSFLFFATVLLWPVAAFANGTRGPANCAARQGT